MPRSARWLAAALAMLAAACGGSTEPSGSGNGASQIQIVSGNGQVQLVGQPLVSPLVVKVVNSSGTAVSGATVTFSVASGAATVSPSSATTDASGQAKTQVTLGASPGNVQINATVGGTSLVVAFVVTAGTSDLPVAEEAAVTLTALGNCVARVTDVGVAGIHRVLAKREEIMAAAVVIVIAGMDGALPSVIGGLVRSPVIAVPTSVGYGASFQGLAALLTMLNSCAAGVTVVNIDNGFGAAVAASRITHSGD